MTESKHTPGPLKAHYVFQNHPVGEPEPAPIWTIQAPRSFGKTPVASVYSSSADADLLAAAPELLEVAVLAVQYLEDIEPNDILNEHETVLINTARAAIRKAKG